MTAVGEDSFAAGQEDETQEAAFSSSGQATALLDKPARPLPVVGGEPAPALVTMGEDVVLRKSNEVAGFRYSRLKGIWFTFAMFLKLPFIPLWPIFIARMARDPELAGKRYFRTVFYCFKAIYQQIRFGSIWRMVKFNVLMTPEQVERRIAMRRGACSRCAKCCKQFDCIFLGQDQATGDYFCKVYATDYWYYGTCGRYPLDQLDIDYHACPGFSFQEERHPGAKTSLPA